MTLKYVKCSALASDHSRGPMKLIFAGKIENNVFKGGKPFKICLFLYLGSCPEASICFLNPLLGEGAVFNP